MPVAHRPARRFNQSLPGQSDQRWWRDLTGGVAELGKARFRSAPSRVAATGFVTVMLCLLTMNGLAIVTSDGPGTHVVEPGVPAFGVNLDGVVKIGIEAFPDVFTGTGSLISDTHVLTAAHVITDGPFLLSVRFDLAGEAVWIPVKGYAIHPDYGGIGFANDLAVLELESAAPAGVPRYELYSQTDEVGEAFVIAGYGKTGNGATGATIADGQKRAGRNRYEITGAQIKAAYGTTEDFDPAPWPDDNLYFDFDSGEAANDLSLPAIGAADLGFGNDEVCIASGDSGGPSFIEGGDGIFRIAGVNSTINSNDLFASYDFDNQELNSSWGEFAAVARVSTNLAFIQDAVAGNLRYQRIFDDGGTHVVDDDLNAGPITVQNSPAPADAPTSVTLVNAIVDGLATVGLQIEESSLVKFESGLIEGYPGVRTVGSGRFEMSGGTVRVRALPIAPISFGIVSTGISANSDAEVRISGGTVEGGLLAIHAPGDSQVFITDGTFTGSQRAILTEGIAEIDGGSFTSPGIGVFTRGSGSLTVRGGSFHGDVNGGRSGNTARVVIFDGTFTGGTEGFLFGDNSQVEISGGSFSAPVGFFANSQAKVWIGGGTFVGSIDAFQSADSTEVVIEGGLFEADEAGLLAFGSSEVAIHGGSFVGGDVDLFIEESARIRIFGYGFNLPFGAVGANEGSISGFYHDGTPFEVSFERVDDGVVELVFSRVAPRESSPSIKLTLSRVSRFGPTEIGSRSRTQRIRVSNLGTRAAKGIRVRTTGRGKRDFAVTRVAKRVLNPGESTVFRITFRPRSVGTRRAVVRVNSSERAATQRLQGRAVPRELIPPRSPFY